MNENFKGNNIKPVESSVEEPVNFEVEYNKILAEQNILKERVKTFEKLVGIVAHDLKNPMNAIVGFSGVAEDKIDEMLINDRENEDLKEIKEYISHITEGGDNSLALLNNLLNWARLQIDGVNPEVHNLNLFNELTEIISSQITALKKKDIELKKEIPSDVEILADQNLLQIVIRNIISNAIKFTKNNGKISVSCKRENGLIHISISDDGVGLPKDKMDQLFDTKNVGESSKGTNDEGGTGIGLSICKEMVEKMNGTISVSSEGEGKGSTFTITLPEGKASDSQD